MRALHTPESVFSLRHAPSWLMLAAAAGAVNVLAYLACSRFVTHVTGTITHVGMDIGSVGLMLDYALVLAAFIGGAAAATAMIDGRHLQKKKPLYAAPLILVAAILTGIALAGRTGTFGPFGGTVETTGDFAFLCILAFAM